MRAPIWKCVKILRRIKESVKVWGRTEDVENIVISITSKRKTRKKLKSQDTQGSENVENNMKKQSHCRAGGRLGEATCGSGVVASAWTCVNLVLSKPEDYPSMHWQHAASGGNDVMAEPTAHIRQSCCYFMYKSYSVEVSTRREGDPKHFPSLVSKQSTPEPT